MKESRESKYWLRIGTAKSLGRKDLREWLQEADEFVAMLTVSVRRLQTEPTRERTPRGQLSILNPQVKWLTSVRVET